MPSFSATAASQYAGIELRAMVWRGHYLAYRLADAMLHAPVDRAFMREMMWRWPRHWAKSWVCQCRCYHSMPMTSYYRETFVLVLDRQRPP